MKAKHILCPVDFSDYSDAALDLASSLARDTGAKLYIIHVEEQASLTAMLRVLDGHRLFKKLPTATEVRFEHDVLLGDPAREIVKFAKEKGVDLIVMGSHGRTGLSRVLMGSVAEVVARTAPVPVLTLKADSKKLTSIKV